MVMLGAGNVGVGRSDPSTRYGSSRASLQTPTGYPITLNVPSRPVSGTTSSGFARTPASSPYRGMSADAASVWARGGTAAIQAAQEAHTPEAWKKWTEDALSRGEQYVGIDDLGAWAAGQGISPVPYLGTNVKGPNSSLLYQAPEYQEFEVNAVIQRMTPQQLADFREAAKAAGLYDDSDYVPLTDYAVPADVAVMRRLMTEANLTQASTWEEALATRVENPSGELDGTGFGEEPAYSGPVTEKSIIYNETSRDAGRSILRNLMRELLGREPTDTEVAEYVANLNKKEKANPEIVQTVSEMDEGTMTGTSTQTTLGQAPVASEVLRDEVEEGNAAESFTYQAQDYFNHLMQVI